jgi:hypothetical protein
VRSELSTLLVGTLLLACSSDSPDELSFDHALESAGLDGCRIASERAAEGPEYDSLRALMTNRSGPVMAKDSKGMARAVELSLEWLPETFTVLVTSPGRGKWMACGETVAVAVRVRLTGIPDGEFDTTIVVVPNVHGSAFIGRNEWGQHRQLSLTIEERETHGMLSGIPVQRGDVIFSPPLVTW